MSSVVNTNMLTVYYEDIAMVTSDIHAPLDGEFFGRPTRQNNQRFGAIGTGNSISPTDFPHQGFEVVHKAEIDVEVLQEKLNTTISSHMSSPPKVSTAPEDDVCSSDEAFDKNQPPTLSFRDAFDSDSSSDIVPPSASRVNQQPLSALFDEWIATRQLLQESSHTNSPPSSSARLAILEPKPRLAWHTTYEQLLISASEEALGDCSTTIKTDMPRGLARIRAKAPHHIDLWRANKPDEPPDTMMVAVKGGSERACFPCAPLKNVPLPETTPGNGHSVGYQAPTVPITPRRQVTVTVSPWVVKFVGLVFLNFVSLLGRTRNHRPGGCCLLLRHTRNDEIGRAHV